MTREAKARYRDTCMYQVGLRLASGARSLTGLRDAQFSFGLDEGTSCCPHLSFVDGHPHIAPERHSTFHGPNARLSWVSQLRSELSEEE